MRVHLASTTPRHSQDGPWRDRACGLGRPREHGRGHQKAAIQRVQGLGLGASQRSDHLGKLGAGATKPLGRRTWQRGSRLQPGGALRCGWRSRDPSVWRQAQFECVGGCRHGLLASIQVIGPTPRLKVLDPKSSRVREAPTQKGAKKKPRSANAAGALLNGAFAAQSRSRNSKSELALPERPASFWTAMSRCCFASALLPRRALAMAIK